MRPISQAHITLALSNAAALTGASTQREQIDQLLFPHFAALKNSSGTPYASMQLGPRQERAVRRTRFTAIGNSCAGDQCVRQFTTLNTG
jgi:hypothetical protein